MFSKRYVVIAIYEPEEEDDESYPSCTYYDYDELDKALKEFEETKGWTDIQVIDCLTGRTIRQMESGDATMPIALSCEPPDPADWWKPDGWKLTED
jgi:hypothetical protein